MFRDVVGAIKILFRSKATVEKYNQMIDKSYTYLLVNLGSLIVPFIFSFHPKLQFYKTWRAFYPSVFITGAFFISWDVLFTSMSIWSFNEDYVIGVYLLGIPLEEWLFFFCIPYASVFTYHCFKILLKLENTKLVKNITIYLLIPLITVVAFIFLNRLYTSVTFLLTALFLVAHALGFFSATNLGKFLVVYLILLIPFLITNGILTGSWIDEPVVFYNPDHILGPRILTIPIEDTIYGLFLLLLNVTIYEWLLNRNKSNGLAF
jgi:lycopene cyclase domain-containing protein